MGRKISGVSVFLIVFAWSSCSFACGPFLPEKNLSFFSSQFISDPTLKEYVRLDGFFSVPRGTLVEKYRENLTDWQQYLAGIGVRASLDELAYIVYELDELALTDMLNVLSDIRKFYEALTQKDWNTLLAFREDNHFYNFKELRQELTAEAPDIRWNMERTFLLLQQLEHQHLSNVANYLLFTKRCEILVPSYVGERTWEETPANSPDISLKKQLLDTGKQGYRDCHSEWLKMRYAYQLVRLAHYMGAFEESIALYDEFAAPLHVENVGFYLAMEQKAGALHGANRNAEALYWFARAFGKLPERNDRICRSINMVSPTQEQWRESLSFAASPREKSAIWVLWTIYHEHRQSVEPLRQMYELSPQSELLENLLLWHVVKCEQRVFIPFLLSGKPEELDRAYLSEFKQYVLDVARDGKIRQPAIWYAVAGYLAFMETFLNQNYDEALSYLEYAEAEASRQPDLLHQIRLLRHLATLYQSPQINQAFTAALYPELQWLIAQKETIIYQSVMTTLAQQFLLHHDVPRAACCLFEAKNNHAWPETELDYERAAANVILDIYATENDIEALYAFINQPSHSLFDFLLVRNFPFSDDTILDLWGTHLLRNRRFEKAVQIFERIPPDYWRISDYCNGTDIHAFCLKQFTTSFWDNPHHAAQKFARTNKFAFAKSIIALESQAKDDTRNADRYYWQIANALYNTPYWGYVGTVWDEHLTWALRYEFHSSSYPFTLPTLSQEMARREQNFLNVYGTRFLAREYYEKVAAATKDDELAAESLELAQRCSIKAFGPLHGYGKYDFGRNLPPPTRDYFRELHERYAKTKFHQRLLEECPAFRDYARQR